MDLEIALAGTVATVSLDREAAPATCDALVSLLPCRALAHYAKIAGDEFMMHLPLVLDVERSRAVAALPTGAVAFWPERQLFCVYYGALQEEDATVTFLGRVTEHLDDLASAAERLRLAGGPNARIELRLAAAPGQGGAPRSADPAGGAAGPLAERIREACAAMAERMPRDVVALLARRGIRRPAGPLLYAEAETRKLHEVLWVLRLEARELGATPSSVPRVLRHFAGRLGGWYQLREAAGLTERVAAFVAEAPAGPALAAMEALLLYAGRLNMWLDAGLPWSRLDRAVAGPEIG